MNIFLKKKTKQLEGPTVLLFSTQKIIQSKIQKYMFKIYSSKNEDKNNLKFKFKMYFKKTTTY